jgi:hypothetical protein
VNEGEEDEKEDIFESEIFILNLNIDSRIDFFYPAGPLMRGH